MRGLIVLFILFISCDNSEKGSAKEKVDIKKIERTRTINQNYLVINKFPEINFNQFSDSGAQIINRYFENVNELYLVTDSIDFKGDSKKIVGDYIVLSDDHDLMAFEFFIKKGENVTNYKPVFFNSRSGEFFECEDVIGNLSRNKLRDFVEIYSNNSNVNINLNAYKDGNNTKLSYAKKGDTLYLYAGEEGEFGGKYKIKIPFSSVSK